MGPDGGFIELTNGMSVQPSHVASCDMISFPIARSVLFSSYTRTIYTPGESVADFNLPFHVEPVIVMSPYRVLNPPALFSPLSGRPIETRKPVTPEMVPESVGCPFDDVSDDWSIVTLSPVAKAQAGNATPKTSVQNTIRIVVLTPMTSPLPSYSFGSSSSQDFGGGAIIAAA